MVESMTDLLYFTPETGTDYVPLSRTKSGRLVRKEILKTGTLNHPGVKGGKVQLTGDMFDHIVENFDNKVCDIVQFPLADQNNAHTEDPLRNGGEVVKLKHEGDSLYAYIDVRKSDVLQGITDKTIIGASAMLAMDYTDTRTGEKAGPTLLHVAATNRPHVTELEDFEVIAASVDGNGEAVLLTASDQTTDPSGEESTMTTKDEAFAFLKDSEGIDVQALLDSAEANKGVAELSSKLTDALNNSGIIKLSNGEEAKAEDLVLAVGQIVDDNVKLSGRLDSIEKERASEKAAAEVDADIAAGFFQSAQRDTLVKINLSAHEDYVALKPEQPVLKLSGEPTGFAPADEQPIEDLDATIAKYADLA